MDKESAEGYAKVLNGVLKMDDAPGVMKRETIQKLADSLGGIPCWGCLPGSAADKAGLKYGDVVLEINGQATPDHNKYGEARSLREDGCTFKIWRNGVEIEGEMTF